MANNSAPTGRSMVKKDRAKHALGLPLCFNGTAGANNAMTVTGVLATDIVCGVIDLTTPGTAQATLANVTPATDALASGDTPWTGTRKYLVVVWRKAA